MWYNAKIEKIHADGACEVLFLDYGNDDKVKPGDIVVTAKDIPEGEERDKCVDPGPGQDHPERKLEVEVGQLVIARWSEDKVWYRAKILEVGQGSLQVLFTDYGNEEKVEEKNIVLCGADIPAEEESFVDGNVEGFKGSEALSPGDLNDGGTDEKAKKREENDNAPALVVEDAITSTQMATQGVSGGLQDIDPLPATQIVSPAEFYISLTAEVNFSSIFPDLLFHFTI